MAIIDASRSFSGSALSNDSISLIKPGVRTLNFSDSKNQEGVYLFILPPYKRDSQGNGVWYRVIRVRDNFGLETKERFVEVEDSPIAYFTRQLRIKADKYKGYAEVQKVMREGQERKVYPPHGRVTNRVLFNVAYVSDLGKGAHVIEVPSYGVASKIEEHHRKPQPDGTPTPLVCDYKCATPVFFKLDKKKAGMPWEVIPEGAKKYQLPEALADADNLYNLDEAFIVQSNDELYEKLRKITPKEIFDDCMSGYLLGSGNVAVEAGHPAVAAKATIVVDAPAAAETVAPAAAGLVIPKATIEGAKPAVVDAAGPVQVAGESNPSSIRSAADAKAWLQNQKKA